MQEPLLEASKLAVETLRNGNKILLCGNGGSAADAQHIAKQSLQEDIKLKEEDYQELHLQQIQVH